MNTTHLLYAFSQQQKVKLGLGAREVIKKFID